MRSRALWTTLVVITCAAVVVACGGGSGSGKGTTSGIPISLEPAATSDGPTLQISISSSKSSTHAASTTATATTSAAASHAATSAAATSSHAAAHTSAAPACSRNPDTYTGSQHITVAPNTCLRDGQTVSVSASGFPANRRVVVVECADKGDATAQADCGALHFVNTDRSGTVSNYQVQVFVHISGSNHDVCSPTVPCLVSVSVPALTHAQEADRRITFA